LRQVARYITTGAQMTCRLIILNGASDGYFARAETVRGV